MKLLPMSLLQASNILNLKPATISGHTHFLTPSGAEITLAEADSAIASSERELKLIAESTLVGGAQYWHVKNISAWTVVRSHLLGNTPHS